MQPLYIAAFLVLALAIAFLVIAKSQGNKKQKAPLASLSELTNVTRRDPLSKREQEMYAVLCAALPDCVILAQVAFSALLTTTSQQTRNRFDRKVADFVICSKQLSVIAVVELDDASHKSKTAADQERDSLLNNAGYKTLRYKNVPDQSTLKKDLNALPGNGNAELKTA
jgi:hypothetical protein